MWSQNTKLFLMQFSNYLLFCLVVRACRNFPLAPKAGVKKLSYTHA